MKSPHVQTARCQPLTYPCVSISQHLKVQDISTNCHVPGAGEMLLMEVFNPPLQRSPSILQQEEGTCPYRFYYRNCPDICQEHQRPLGFAAASARCEQSLVAPPQPVRGDKTHLCALFSYFSSTPVLHCRAEPRPINTL